MKNRRNTNKMLKNLYSRFSTEMDSVKLPSDAELMQLLDRHDAASAHRAPFVPLSRRRHTWHYVAAAAVLAGLLVFGWMAWPQGHAQAPVVAETRTDTIEALPSAQNDSVLRPLPAAPETDAATRVASTRQPAVPTVITDSLMPRETVLPTAVPDAPQPQIAAADDVDSLPAELQPDRPADTNGPATTKPTERQIEDYPDRPTIDETEKIIRKENSRRALRNNKQRERKNKRKNDFIDKQDERKDDVRIVTPKHQPPPQPHYIGTAATRVIMYY